MRNRLRLGRISFLNVLPIYHPLEAGILPHDFDIVAAPPAILNDMMSAGQLHISSCSCFEYAKHPEKYYLVRDLSIGSHGPVMSVLLLSRMPLRKLAGQKILISGESHTSVALLRLLMRDQFGVNVEYETGNVTSALASGPPPAAFLAIGDEALRLRNHPEYPHCLDLAEAWRHWTALPFVFGLWVISARAVKEGLFQDDPGEILRKGRDWGMGHMEVILDLTSAACPLEREELRHYYLEGLTFNLGKEEIEGLICFYEKLARAKMIEKMPELRFY